MMLLYLAIVRLRGAGYAISSTFRQAIDVAPRRLSFFFGCLITLV